MMLTTHAASVYDSMSAPADAKLGCISEKKYCGFGC